jgi:hypothetical protein
MPDDNTMPVVRDRSATAIAVYRPPEFLMPTSIGAVKELAKMYCEADWVPKAYRNRDGQPIAAKVEVGIMHGLEVGLRPLAALQSIAVINGMPCVWGDGMLGLVRDSGLLEDIEEAYEGSGDDLAAICTLKRKGQHTPITGRFTVAMAKKAGLWEKQGPWQGYPSRMLKMRARSWALRDGFADVLRGIRSAEEVLDMGDLVEQDGSYVPARPTREQFAAGHQTDAPDDGKYRGTATASNQGAKDVAPAKVEHFEVTTGDGEVKPYKKASAAVSFFENELRQAAAIGGQALEGLWESNGLILTQLRETERGQSADMLGTLYKELLDECDTKERAAKAAAQEKAAQQSQQQAKAAEPKPDGRQPPVPWNFEHQGYKRPPTSPLAGGNWIAFVPWFADQFRDMPTGMFADFLSEAHFGKEFDFIAERRKGDYEELIKIAKDRGVNL